ncbi:DUF2079 domain-containing protein [Streptacidiphilus sp. N1-12]|uniref:DUF2079 domain-containing protein n=2 Tax=Streptacidiphilus alkalitolerans TaxID=3342712 RepID=A0ABV6XAB3_9ACTN
MTTDTDAPAADIGVPAESRFRRFVPGSALWPHLVLAALFVLVYSTISIMRYTHYASMSWDNSIFVQEVDQYAHLRAPIVTIKGVGYNILGDHFSPIIALLGPFYLLFPSTVTLLVGQAALFGWSVGIVSKTVAEVTTRAKGLAFGFAYGLSFGLQRAADAGFHEIAFGVPLLAMVMRNLVLKRWYPAAFWALPLVLVKEDMGLTVAVVGVVLLLQRQWTVGILLTVFGPLMFLLTLNVVIPHFNIHDHYDYAANLPGGSIVQSLFGDPLHTLNTMVTPVIKLHTAGYLLAITAFMALRSPLVLLVLPTMFWRFTGSVEYYWDLNWHYNAVLMPILFLAVIDGIQRADAGRIEWLRSYATKAALPAVIAISVTLCVVWALPITNANDPSVLNSADRVAMLKRAAATIPDGATVEANITLMDHLATRTKLYWVGTGPTQPAQYFALDLSYGWSSPPTDVAAYAKQEYPNATYKVIFNEGQFQVAQLVSG